MVAARYNGLVATRRRFLWLVGASSAGIFMARTGLIELPRNMVLQLAGTCSFCGKDRREVFGLAGIMSRAERICDECIGLCFDILGEEIEEIEKAARVAGKPPMAAAEGEFERLLLSASSDPAADPREIVARLQQLVAPPDRRVDLGVRDFHCSFCDRSRSDVRKLISGPRVFICDDCTGDAGGLLAASGWQFTPSA